MRLRSHLPISVALGILFCACSDSLDIPEASKPDECLSRSMDSETSDSIIETYAYLYDTPMRVRLDPTKKYVIRSVAGPDQTATFKAPMIPAGNSKTYFGEIVDASEIGKLTAQNARSAVPGEIVAIEDVTDEGTPLHQFVFVGLKNRSELKKLEELASEIGCEIIGPVLDNDLIIQLSTGLESEYTSIPASTYLYEHGDFKFVDPGFKIEYEPLTSSQAYPAAYASAEPRQSEQWGLDMCKIPQAWKTTKGSPDITLAIIDTGFKHDHPEFSSHMHPYSFDYGYGYYIWEIEKDHGSRVASIAAASHNGIDMAGVAPMVKIMGINRICHDVLNCSECIQNAYLNGADVINCSWGSRTNAWDNVIIETIHNAVSKGRNGKGCVVVFASGKDGEIYYPAKAASGIIVVGSVDENKKASEQSSGYGPELTVAAPGEYILSLTLDGQCNNEAYGSSLAAPHVSGLAALILSVRPELKSSQVKQVIIETASHGFHDNKYGYGIINAEYAINAVTGKHKISCPSANNGIVIPEYDKVTYRISDVPRGASVRWTSSCGATLVESDHYYATFSYGAWGSQPEKITAVVDYLGKKTTVSADYTIKYSIASNAMINSVTALEGLDFLGDNMVHLYADCTVRDAPLVWEITWQNGTSFELVDFPLIGDADYSVEPGLYKSLQYGSLGSILSDGATCKIRVYVDAPLGDIRYCSVTRTMGQWVVESSMAPLSESDEDQSI